MPFYLHIYLLKGEPQSWLPPRRSPGGSSKIFYEKKRHPRAEGRHKESSQSCFARKAVCCTSYIRSPFHTSKVFIERSPLFHIHSHHPVPSMQEDPTSRDIASLIIRERLNKPIIPRGLSSHNRHGRTRACRSSMADFRTLKGIQRQ